MDYPQGGPRRPESPYHLLLDVIRSEARAEISRALLVTRLPLSLAVPLSLPLPLPLQLPQLSLPLPLPVTLPLPLPQLSMLLNTGESCRQGQLESRN